MCVHRVAIALQDMTAIPSPVQVRPPALSEAACGANPTLQENHGAFILTEVSLLWFEYLLQISIFGL